jgi:hypothetical protein
MVDVCALCKRCESRGSRTVVRGAVGVRFPQSTHQLSNENLIIIRANSFYFKTLKSSSSCRIVPFGGGEF